jgi:hypothetical protein
VDQPITGPSNPSVGCSAFSAWLFLSRALHPACGLGYRPASNWLETKFGSAAADAIRDDVISNCQLKTESRLPKAAFEREVRGRL